MPIRRRLDADATGVITAAAAYGAEERRGTGTRVGARAGRRGTGARRGAGRLGRRPGAREPATASERSREASPDRAVPRDVSSYDAGQPAAGAEPDHAGEPWLGSTTAGYDTGTTGQESPTPGYETGISSGAATEPGSYDAGATTEPTSSYESAATTEPEASSSYDAGVTAAAAASSEPAASSGYDAGVTAAGRPRAAEPANRRQADEQAAAAASAAPAGWYADPAGRYELRYWDGSAWTEHVSRAGQQYTDPPVA